jgi:probable phosphoglycerate mutase
LIEGDRMVIRAMTHIPIVFVRHGETDWNATGRLQGHRDIPLNDRGRGQARRNGRAIAEYFPDIGDFDFVASPLARARETMEMVRTSLNLEPAGYRLDDRLKEVHHGAWEGFTDEELAEHDPYAAARRRADLWHFMPSGGESYELLSERVWGWFATLDHPAVVVAHGGVGRVLRRRILDIDPRVVVAEVFPQDKVFHWHGGTETVI